MQSQMKEALDTKSQMYYYDILLKKEKLLYQSCTTEPLFLPSVVAQLL